MNERTLRIFVLSICMAVGFAPQGVLAAIPSLHSADTTSSTSPDSLPEVSRKNPELAGTLSVFLPGLGHMYAGETVKGSVLTGLFGVAIGTVIASQIGSTHDSIRPRGWASVVFVSAVYVYALIDAPFAAGRTNEAQSSSHAHLLNIPAGTGLLSMDAIATGGRFGVTVSYSFGN
jgi:TM2 domain-containing membrane protein YozV